MKKSIATVLFASISLAGITMSNLAQASLWGQQCDFSKHEETTPASRFEINRTDGTAFDTKTKLTWKICAEGQSYSEGHCTGNITSFTWDNAMQTFGDKSVGWRLPSADELGSIVEELCAEPSINKAIFPNTPITPVSSFWSSSIYAQNQTFAWFVNFHHGFKSFDVKSTGSHVRLVNGEQWIDPLQEERRKQAVLAAQQKREAELAEEQRKLVAAQAELAVVQAAAQAEKDAYVICNDKTICDKTFSLTQIYIKTMASQKIQLATDTIIETYNPTENGNIGMSAVKIPGRGSSATISLTVQCKVDERGIYDKLCTGKKLDIYNGFRPFVKKMLGD